MKRVSGMETRMTTDQRRALRDYISAVGLGKNPVLLKIPAEIDDDFELLTTCVVASVLQPSAAGNNRVSESNMHRD